jgi:hypothetical protein
MVGGAILGGAATGALASVVSQGIGIATGLQDKFSWKAVGLAAIAGGVGGAVGPGGLFKGDGLFGGMGSKVVSAALRGAASNAVTQGIGIATGLQKKFDWAGVASAGVGAGVGQWAGSKWGLSGTSGRIASGMAGGIAASAAESLVTGRNFGDVLTKNLPSIVSNTLGGILADQIAARGRGGATGAGDPNGVVGPGGTATGAGDATAEKPTTGVGGGRVGRSSGNVVTQLGDIVVTADRATAFYLQNMSDYQFGQYRAKYGDLSFREGAAWFYASPDPTRAPAYGMSIGSPGRFDVSLSGSFRNMQSFGLYSCGPAQQYMMGDGSVFTGTPAALGRFQQQRVVQADMAYLDRVRGSTLGGIALGASRSMGASPATQDLVYGLGSSADGLVMAYGGVRGAAIPGNNSQTSLSVEANLRLRYMPEWTAEQRAAADLKVNALNLSDTTVSQAVRGGTSARSMFAKENGPIAPRYDIDHLIDLQLGGSHTLRNFWPLDSSVNRSLGAQIQNQIQGLPPGTKINGVTIGN